MFFCRRFDSLFLILILARFAIRDLEKQYNKTEDDLKALQSVGQIIGEVLKQLDEERCEPKEEEKEKKSKVKDLGCLTFSSSCSLSFF